MTIIAMTREMGSLGRDVAIGLSQRLGIDLVHHELVEASVASHLNQNQSEVHKFLEGGTTWLDSLKTDTRRMGHFTQEAILELASRGNIILRGWGASQLLKDIPHVLRLRVCAPLESRTTVVMARTGIDDREKISSEIEANDAAHAQVIGRFFRGDWRDPEGYDLVLNTERLTVDECINLILQVLTHERFQETEASQQAIADKLLELRIQQRLSDDVFEGKEVPGIVVSVSSGKVFLEGYVQGNHWCRDIERVAQTIPGVVAVSNNLEPLRGTME